uniref:DUF4149 domain-containing protein n=1 Tax=Thermomicrobium roseum TaxID=500 RepID=A0A7C5VW11_THERO
MTEWLWTTVRWIHLVAMAFWLGGQLFLILVVRPILRRELDRPQQTTLTAALGRRFSPLAWVSLVLLIVTGWLTGEHRGVVWSTLLEPRNTYGRILATKMLLVALLLLLTLVHGRIFGPRLAALAQSREPADRQRYHRLLRLSVVVSALNLLLTLAIVFLSARLVA